MSIVSNNNISSLYKLNDELETSVSLDYISFYKIRDKIFLPSRDLSFHFEIDRIVSNKYK